MVASLSGAVDLPVAAYDLSWDGLQAGDRVFDHFTNGETVDVASVAQAYLWRNTAYPDNMKVGYDLPFADIIDGELKIVPRGVQACAGGHGVGQLDVSDADKQAIRGRIGELYAKIQAAYPDSPSNPFDKEV